MDKKYTVNWRSKETSRRLHDNQQALGFSRPNIDEAEKDRLLASLATDASAYGVEIEENCTTSLYKT